MTRRPRSSRGSESVTRPEVVLASNTSSIPIRELGAASGRPEKVIGMHFFNPPPVMALLELTPSKDTSRGDLRVRPCLRDRHPRQNVRPLGRRGGIHREPAPDPVPVRRDPAARVGVRHAGGHRHGDAVGARASDGAAHALRPDRTRHAARDRRGAAGGLPRRAEVRGARAAPRSRRARASSARRPAAGSTTPEEPSPGRLHALTPVAGPRWRCAIVPGSRSSRSPAVISMSPSSVWNAIDPARQKSTLWKPWSCGP